MSNFKLLSTKNNLRHGIIQTQHGILKTPFFMPDATRGLVKFLSNDDLKKTGVGPMVVNTYHLYLQPGLEIIKKAGGIHNFINYHGPLLSDSGGFQVFSLVHRHPEMGKILEDKVVFKSPLDGSIHEITPEKSIQIQFDLGTDMLVCFDDCPPNNLAKEKLKQSVQRTINWASRCKKEYLKQLKKRSIKDNEKPLLFGVIQGGLYHDLRQYCAQELIKIGFDGYGFGAMPLDEAGKFDLDLLAFTAQLIPENTLRFALGIGKPEDILACAKVGWDMFDCVIPTRAGRHGSLIHKDNNQFKTININNAQYKMNFTPINTNSKIKELKEYSLAYLNHLFKINDPLGAKLGSLNNLEVYMKLIKELKSK